MERRALIPVLILLSGLGCSRKEEARRESPPAVSGVRIETVAAATSPEAYEAPGTVRSKVVAVLSSKVVGRVTAVRVREGEHVRAGQLLLDIDAREAENQLAKANAGRREAEEAIAEVDRALQGAEANIAAAEAQKELASSTLKRYQALLERQSVSRQEFDEVQARHKGSVAQAEAAAAAREALRAKRLQVLARTDQARADIGAARTFASYSQIRSPMAGIVLVRHVEPGSLAAPGAPLLTVEDDRNYRLEATLEENRLAAVRPGAAVSVRIEALGEKELPGRVDEVSPASDPSSRSVLVKISLPQSRDLRSGLFGRAVFRGPAQKVLTVPARAVVERGQLTGVYVVDPAGAAHLRLIRTGKRFGTAVEVLSGLSEGERIAVDGIERIVEGAKVGP